MKTATIVWAFALFCVGSAWADLPPFPSPGPPPPAEPPREVTAKLRVRETNDKHYRIMIPKKLFQQRLQVGQLEAPADAAPAGPGSRTLLAGFALSAAACSMVLVRKRSIAGKVLVTLAVGAATYLGSQWAYANLAPPQRPVDPPQMDTIVIQVRPDVRDVLLYVPANRRGPVEQPAAADERKQGFGSGIIPESRPPAATGRPPQK